LSEPDVSPAALDDIEDIWWWIATNSERAANRMIERLWKAFSLLTDSPGIGHPRQDLTDRPLRFWYVKPYLVIYEVVEGKARIARVIHSSRDVRALLRS
jgi:plasmid stabilization system protein ParE